MARGGNSTTDTEHVQLPNFWLHKASGNLAIKRKGRLYYCGKTLEEASAFYLDHRERIDNGRPIVVTSDCLTVGDICNHFVLAKKKQQESKGDSISYRTYLDYKKTAERVIKKLGRNTPVDELRPPDFLKYKEAFQKTRNPIGTGNEITRVRSIFIWAYESEYLDKPMRFGPDFKRPRKRVVKRHKRLKGATLFDREAVNALLDEAGIHLRAMIYLGINCGFKNHDIGQFPLNEFNPTKPWIDWVRPKTEEVRRCPLWPETVEAMKQSLERRPKPTTKEAKKAFFVYRNGDVWVKADPNYKDQVRQSFVHGLRRLEIWKSGMGFSWLRHTHRTWSDHAKDKAASDLIMGHSDNTMAAEYRHGISDKRLLDVTNMVKAILNGEVQL